MKIVLLLSLLVLAGCGRSETSQKAPAASLATASPQQSTTAATSPQVKPKLDACAMLTSQDIESVQGETLKETKLSEKSADGLNVSQCFFTLPTFTNSISLSVTQKADGPGARDPRQFWRETFHREKDRGEEEEAESRPPQKISGIGDEAFWMTSPAAGILYVLKGSSYVRISIGGRGDQQTKLSKSKALARKVIDRL
ncbi:MAG TPA: DUF3558 family protein [Pyrinomonadaceae bacterium]|nr:DUF3558 family protein [Pyrinomonadaceae bacterium]